ncbi:MAG TPA: RDD family protein [Galbitalea sp.]
MAAAAEANNLYYYEEPEEVVMTGEAVGLDLHPTGYALAAAGAIIDWLVYVVGGILFLVFAVELPLGASEIGQDSAVQAAAVSATLVLALIVIPTAVELLSKGKSLGRLAVGARIVRDDGGSIGFRHAFIRSLVGLIEIVPFGAVAAIVGLLNGRSKRLGDFLAGTYSQYERVAKVTEPVFGVPDQLLGWAATADVARIPLRLAIRSSRFLRQAAQLTPATRTAHAAGLAAELNTWVSSIPPVEPELFVAAVVALRRERELAAYSRERAELAHLNAALTWVPPGFPPRD